MATLYIMCGIPGSGKSTFARSHIRHDAPYKENRGIIHVSRDIIRFHLVKEDEPYFSREDEVWKEFVRQINYYLNEGFDVMADATHINTGARRKLLKEIKVKDIDLQAMYFDVPISICLKRNSKREGRECVPESAIKRMYSQFEEPSFEEGFSTIYTIDAASGKLEIRRK